MSEQTIVAALLADSAVSALVGTRIAPMRLTQGTTFPAITYSRISGGHITTLAGTYRENPRIQVDCWGNTYSEAKALAEAVKVAMTTATSFRSVIVAEIDDYEDDPEVYRVTIDFSVWS